MYRCKLICVHVCEWQCAKIGYFLLFYAIFSWRAIASQYYILMSGFAGHIDSWLAVARHEKIDNLEKPNGYNSCNAQLCFSQMPVMRIFRMEFAYCDSYVSNRGVCIYLALSRWWSFR